MTDPYKKERKRAENARRQREYRERQKRHKANLLGLARDTDTLEDSIKLAANKGDVVAMEIVAEFLVPDAANLATWFQERARKLKTPRSASRNKKKPATGTFPVVAG